MNKNIILKACIASALIFSLGCFDDKSDNELTKKKKTSKAITNTQLNGKKGSDEPSLQPISKLTNSDESKPSINSSVSDLKQSSGYYVLQVGIKESNNLAKNLVEKLSSDGISDAYVAEVDNPGDLEGTLYRVRVGYFSKIADASAYGEEVLAPLGYAFWVDNKTNDHVGSPSSGGGDFYESNSNYNEPAVEETPVAEESWSNESTVEETPEVVEETPAADEGWGNEPVAEPVPEVVEEAPVVEETPAADEGWDNEPVAEPAPEVEETPEVVEETPAADEGWDNEPVAEPAPEVVEEAPVAEPVPEVVEEAPVADESWEEPTAPAASSNEDWGDSDWQ